METVNLRELRGARLRHIARQGKLLGITDHKALVSVVIPVATAWVEHLIDYNWSHVRRTIAEGEQAMASGEPMDTLDDVIAEARPAQEGGAAGPEPLPARLAIPLAAALTGKIVTPTPQGNEVIDQLQAAFTVPGTGQEAGSAGSSVLTVRIGELTSRVIEQAGAAGQTIALTHDRELIGIVVPVTPGLVQFLVEQNLSRVAYNIVHGEKELTTKEKLTTLSDVADHKAASQAPN